MTKTILVVDDHANVRTLIQDYLGEHGYRVVAACDGVEALAVAQSEQPNLILLDIMMPNLNGLDFIRTYRKKHNAPIILLTARLTETDKVVGLELGADDYVTKPFGMAELLARVRAMLRRTESDGTMTTGGVYRSGDLALDRSNYSVTVKGQPVSLTPSEFELLSMLMEFPKRVFTREVLLARLQGNNYEGAERTVDVHIRNLRTKIEPDPANPIYILTVFGVGYRFQGD